MPGEREPFSQPLMTSLAAAQEAIIEKHAAAWREFDAGNPEPLRALIRSLSDATIERWEIAHVR